MLLDGAPLRVQNLRQAQAKLGIPSVPTANAYTISNDTPLRTFDVATATPTDALNAIAALVVDLKAAGILPP